MQDVINTDHVFYFQIISLNPSVFQKKLCMILFALPIFPQRQEASVGRVGSRSSPARGTRRYSFFLPGDHACFLVSGTVDLLAPWGIQRLPGHLGLRSPGSGTKRRPDRFCHRATRKLPLNSGCQWLREAERAGRNTYLSHQSSVA